MEEGRRRERPTAEEVIARLKDDGDFDNLRRKIIRKVKENVRFPISKTLALDYCQNSHLFYTLITLRCNYVTNYVIFVNLLRKFVLCC